MFGEPKKDSKAAREVVSRAQLNRMNEQLTNALDEKEKLTTENEKLRKSRDSVEKSVRKLCGTVLGNSGYYRRNGEADIDKMDILVLADTARRENFRYYSDMSAGMRKVLRANSDSQKKISSLYEQIETERIHSEQEKKDIQDQLEEVLAENQALRTQRPDAGSEKYTEETAEMASLKEELAKARKEAEQNRRRAEMLQKSGFDDKLKSAISQTEACEAYIADDIEPSDQEISVSLFNDSMAEGIRPKKKKNETERNTAKTKNSNPSTGKKHKEAETTEPSDNGFSPYTVNLEETISQMGDNEWKFLELVASGNYSVFSEIKTEMMRQLSVSSTAVNTAAKALQNAELITQEKVPNPFGSVFNICDLTPKGRKVCEKHFGRKPAKTQAAKIKGEHSSYEHGYTIRELGEKLKTNKLHKNIQYMDMRKKPIPATGADSVIPDISIEYEDGSYLWLEYETGKMLQSITVFYGKMRKLKNTLDVINIVVPKKQIMDDYINVISNWICTDGPETMSRVAIRLNTAKAAAVSDVDLRNDSNWKCVFTPGENGAEPKYYA